MRTVVVGLLLTLLLAGCAGTPFAPEPRVPLTPQTPAQLAAVDWPTAGVVTLRYTAVLRRLWHEVPMTLLVQLDGAGERGRVAALDGQLGMTLFTLVVEGERVTVRQVAPPLARYQDMLQQLGHTLVRMHTAATDSVQVLKVASEELTLVRVQGATTRTSVYGGTPLRRLAHSGKGPNESWEVEYFRFDTDKQPPQPTGMVLRDHRGGYRLTLWLEAIKEKP